MLAIHIHVFTYVAVRAVGLENLSTVLKDTISAFSQSIAQLEWAWVQHLGE